MRVCGTVFFFFLIWLYSAKCSRHVSAIGLRFMSNKSKQCGFHRMINVEKWKWNSQKPRVKTVINIRSLCVHFCVFFFHSKLFSAGKYHPFIGLSSSGIIQICVTSHKVYSANHHILIKAIWYLFKFNLSLSPSPIYKALSFPRLTNNYSSNYFVWIKTAYLFV